MLTLFSIPKPFEGHIGMIQRNALASWRRLEPAPKILLLGNESGVREAALEFGAEHLPAIASNEFGTPLVSDAFDQAIARSTGRLLLYSNADILFDATLSAAASAVASEPRFLLSGRRWDVDVGDDLTGADVETWSKLFSEAPRLGTLHGPSGMDYFMFPRDVGFRLPAFAVGRVGWDAWLVWHARQISASVIDATFAVTAIHQNHDYSSLRLGYQHRRGPERDLNLRMAGGPKNMLTLREATHLLNENKIARPRGWRALASIAAGWQPYRTLMGLKRRIHASLRT